MRELHIICLFVLSLLVEGTAFARSAELAPAGKSAEDVQAIENRAAEWPTMCLGDWDAQTHMTKTEWRTTCQRESASNSCSTRGALSQDLAASPPHQK